jgi:hypothetical protein
MPRPLVLLLTPVVAAFLWVMLGPDSGIAQQGESRLPGARPTIEAIHYPSLQAAFDALPAEGGMVVLPAGTFEIKEPLRLQSDDILIQGSGTATHIKNLGGEGSPALVIEPGDYDANPRARIWRVHLSDFRITGNEQSGHGIAARGVNELFIEGVTVSEHGGDGILMENCYEDPRVCNSLITYNKGTGLNLIGCHDIVVAANQFEENQDALHCIDGFNLCMTGNCLDDHLGHGVVIENTYGSVVSGNMIEECQGTGIILDRDCYGIALSANVIAHEFSDGIDLRDAHGITVSANSFPIVQRHALIIGPESARIAVTGNTFADSTIGPGEVRRLEGDRQAGGVVLDGTRDVALGGNVFAGVRPKAVEIRGEVRRVTFDGNVLVDVESDHEGLIDSELGETVNP